MESGFCGAYHIRAMADARPCDTYPWTMTTERSIRVRYAALGVGAYVLLLALEVFSEEDPFNLLDFLGDALQMALLVAAATGVSLLAGRFQAQQDERNALIRDLDLARTEGGEWRARAQHYLLGLGEEIQKQFGEWQLTQAEQEVALLMLKGFSHREIAGLRSTSETTIRHQARAIYQKSRLPGRSAFSAYFLEDLLPPHG